MSLEELARNVIELDGESDKHSEGERFTLGSDGSKNGELHVLLEGGVGDCLLLLIDDGEALHLVSSFLLLGVLEEGHRLGGGFKNAEAEVGR